MDKPSDRPISRPLKPHRCTFLKKLFYKCQQHRNDHDVENLKE